jgi:hypothetical protein
MLNRKAAYTNIIVFDMTILELEPTIYRTPGHNVGSDNNHDIGYHGESKQL